MKGIREPRRRNVTTASASLNLSNLRRSVAWTGGLRKENRKEALSQRLQSLLVLELMKDGDRNYLNLSVRGLYNHVLEAITGTKNLPRSDEEDSEGKFSPKLARRKTARRLGDALVTTVPLGQFSQPATVAEDTTESATAASGSLQEQQPHEGGGARVSFKGVGSASTAPTPPPLTLPPPTMSTRKRSVSVTAMPDDHEVTYRERLGGYLHPRDMRRLVTPFSASNEPQLIVRRHVMLLNFDPLRAIILRDRLLVLVPDGADSVLVHLENRVRGGIDEEEVNFFFGPDSTATTTTPPTGRNLTRKHSGTLIQRLLKRPNSQSIHGRKFPSTDDLSSMGKKNSEVASSTQEENDDSRPGSDDDEEELNNDEWDEMKRHEWIDLPFELQCADAVLHVVASLLSEDTFELLEASSEYIQRLLTDNAGMSDDPLTIIRAVKDALREMSSRVKGFVKSLSRILDEDEDMALMNLSRLLTHPERFIQPVPQEVLEEESDEPELILEAHLQTALTLTNALDLMQGQIDSAAELVDQKLDAVRNRLLYANMVLSILSLSVASASLVGSIFGMNLKNYLEEDPNAFKQVTFGTLAGAVAMAFFIVLLLSCSGTIPLSGMSLSSSGGGA